MSLVFFILGFNAALIIWYAAHYSFTRKRIKMHNRKNRFPKIMIIIGVACLLCGSIPHKEKPLQQGQECLQLAPQLLGQIAD